MAKIKKPAKRAKNTRLPVFGKRKGVIVPDLDWDFLHDLSTGPLPPPKPDLVGWRRCTSAEHIGVRASLFQGRPKQPAALIKLLKGDGQPELVGPIKEALRAMQVWQKSDSKKRLEKISVHRVLSFIWANHRLVRNFQKRFVEQTEPPAIDVWEIRLLEKTFYGLTDGNHRTEAAKMLGKRTIKAEISCSAEVNPADWHIIAGGLQNQKTGETISRDADVLAAAAWLGVKSKN